MCCVWGCVRVWHPHTKGCFCQGLLFWGGTNQLGRSWATVEGWSQSNFLECGQAACGKVATTGSQQGHSNPSKHKGIAFIWRIQSTIITNTREPTPRTADYSSASTALHYKQSFCHNGLIWEGSKTEWTKETMKREEVTVCEKEREEDKNRNKQRTQMKTSAENTTKRPPERPLTHELRTTTTRTAAATTRRRTCTRWGWILKRCRGLKLFCFPNSKTLLWGL